MFPTYKQRILIIIAVIINVMLYGQIAGGMRSVDGADGVILMNTVSPVSSIITLLLVTILSVILSALVAGCGNILSGIFVLGAGFMSLGWRGGDISGWLFSIESSSEYSLLFFESLIWFGVVMMSAGSMVLLALFIRERVPSWLGSTSMDQYVEEAYALLLKVKNDSSSKIQQTQGEQMLRAMGLGHYDELLRSPMAFLTAMVVGGMLSWMLMRDMDVKQVSWVIVVCFAIGGMLGLRIFPTRHVAVLCLAPVVVSMVVSLIMVVGDLPSTQLLKELNTGVFFRPGLALPVFWAGAGMVGLSLGLGWAQMLIVTQLDMAGLFENRLADVEEVDSTGLDDSLLMRGQPVQFLDAETGDQIEPMTQHEIEVSLQEARIPILEDDGMVDEVEKQYSGDDKEKKPDEIDTN